MSFAEIVQERLGQMVSLFVVVMLAAGSMVLLNSRMQAGLKYFAGSVAAGLVGGYIAMVFGVPEGLALLIGVAAMATAPSTIAWLEHKTIVDVMDEIRGRGGRGGDGNA